MASSAVQSKRSFLPEGLVVFAKRRAVELSGLAVIALGVAIALALISFNPNDPSWNNVGDTAPTNWLGTPGAYTADIAIQMLGYAAYALVLALIGWGIRIMTHQPLTGFWLYLSLLPIALILTAAAASAFSPAEPGLLGTGLGGYLGQFIYLQLQGLVAQAGVPGFVLFLLLAVIALALLIPAMGIPTHYWQGLGQALLWPLKRRTAVADSGSEPVAEKPKRKTRAAKAPKPAKKTKAKAEKTEKRRARVTRDPPKLREGKRAQAEKQPALDLEPGADFTLPPLALLTESTPPSAADQISEDALEQNARLLESALDDFGVKGEITQVRPGPVVTLYELEPAPGTKSSRVIGLADDIARQMSAISARVAVVPGRNAIGIELPNAKRETVLLRELLGDQAYEKNKAGLPLTLGKDIGGAPVIADLSTMPHLLIAGTTGSGKSVAINTMILSLLYRLTPADCRLIMIDPKMLELSVYDDIPHLLTPVVTDPRKAVVSLKWAVREMEDRYKAMSKLGVRNLSAYNQRLAEAEKKGEELIRTVQTGFDPETGQPIYEDQALDLTPLPLIVVIVDEMADLMMVAGKEVEGSIQRLAQMARASGIHLIMATQRPSVDVITGTIKANFPTRISFQVTSKIDSRTILGEQGAEQLLGRGDMLYLAGGGRVTRVHGPFVSDEEVEEIVNFLKRQGAPDYVTAVTEEPEGGFDTILDMAAGGGSDGGNSDDALYDQAVALVAREGKASTSFVQRHLQIGYNRAARIIERMEKEGVVSSANHVGKREVLVGDHSV
ncbi:MAG: DNA translocase FtsK [Alphaproteobacteria bacterium]